MNATLPRQHVVLSVTKNKVQLIDLLCEELQQIADMPLNTSLVITGRSPVPMEVRLRSDSLVQRFDLKTTHDEADVIIPQQVVALADMRCKTINVICDNTDVFVLLAHYFAEESLSVSLIIILVLPPGVVCPSNCALPMPGTADGDVVSRCQVLGRAGSVHHGADQ